MKLGIKRQKELDGRRTKMKPAGKRQKKLDGGGGGDTSSSRRRRRSDPREQQSLTGNYQIRRSAVVSSYEDARAARPSIYIVVSVSGTYYPAYSLYKVDHPYTSSDDDDGRSPPKRRLHRLATLKTTGGKTFVSAHSQRRRWIVGVGGDHVNRRHTIVFDAETEELIHGPDLLNAKSCPVLVSAEDKVYALSSHPRVKGNHDFEPWFEVLDLSQSKVINGRLEECSWRELPNPPCFPCELTMVQYLYPALITVESYLVLGVYILVSLSRPPNRGTFAFNTVSEKWQQVDTKNLPFVGCATPHGIGTAGGGGGVYYLGMRGQVLTHATSWHDHPKIASAYCIKLLPVKSPATPTSTSDEKDNNPAMKLSITELPIIKSDTTTTTGEAVTGVYFSSLDNGSFCSLNWKARECRSRRSWDGYGMIYDDDDSSYQLPKKAYYITLATYQMEINSADLQDQESEEQTLLLPAVTTTQEINVISNQPELQEFRIRGKSRGFIYPAFLTVL